ncbi:MAG TPA: hypothetical protein VF571_15080 [Pyrinomonadaceae bacterium]|jgi:hypothetical protein
MALDVFLSVGTARNDEQEKFILAVEDYLRVNGFFPRTVGRSDFSYEAPLKCVEQVMKQCSGTVIIAFERLHLVTALEKRGGSKEKSIQGENLPTVWNQIEATMGYVLGHPLLVIVENGLRSEGLLEARYDWWVQKVDLNENALNSREFTGVFSNWKKRVEENSLNKNKQKQNIDFDQITVVQLVNSLKPNQLWATVGALAAILSAVAVAAYHLGAMFKK